LSPLLRLVSFYAFEISRLFVLVYFLVTVQGDEKKDRGIALLC
jgi:hypothetical protein